MAEQFIPESEPVMWLYDFHSWYEGGRAVLMGISPYSIPTYNGPYFLAILYAPFALLPEPIVYAIFLGTNLFLLFKLAGKHGVWALFSFPVLFSLFVGQNDLLITLLTLSGSPWTLSFAMFKPQIGFVVLPWLLRRLDRKGWATAMALSAVMIGLSFILRPTWIQEWFAPKPSLEAYSLHASNLYWLIPVQFEQVRVMITVLLAILIVPVGFFLKERKDSWTVMHLFAPLTDIYSAAALAEWIGPWEMVLSWLAVLLVGGNIHSGMPMFLIGLSILVRRYLELNKGFSREPRQPMALFKALFG